MDPPSYASAQFGHAERYKTPSKRFHPYFRSATVDDGAEESIRALNALNSTSTHGLPHIDPITRAVQKLVELCAQAETTRIIAAKNRAIVNLAILYQQALDRTFGPGRRAVRVAFVRDGAGANRRGST